MQVVKILKYILVAFIMTARLTIKVTNRIFEINMLLTECILDVKNNLYKNPLFPNELKGRLVLKPNIRSFAFENGDKLSQVIPKCDYDSNDHTRVMMYAQIKKKDEKCTVS